MSGDAFDDAISSTQYCVRCCPVQEHHGAAARDPDYLIQAPGAVYLYSASDSFAWCSSAARAAYPFRNLAQASWSEPPVFSLFPQLRTALRDRPASWTRGGSVWFPRGIE